jgi:hypothetical protein
MIFFTFLSFGNTTLVSGCLSRSFHGTEFADSKRHLLSMMMELFSVWRRRLFESL